MVLEDEASEPTTTDEGGVHWAVIAGIVIGVLLVLDIIVAAVVAFILIRKRRADNKEATSEQTDRRPTEDSFSFS